ncbi:hypothetical protein [Frigoribacterium faeni]|uniref:Uncharacterized protein n=1 Tax=Frigoribacterium faeni TaxID=145483 RepID=A0A7W3PJS1_9MICO|nr:hypothetical protein [Frigoribacterium faeni]MBA8814800.1 hypothetical protein [Frigoribacterium faeni]BFF15753.1 hypothetical protein GCM10025699_70560 [Microbacterium flavescens]GEK83591.1 hypothetical protein FFA01_19000 [Frigoribacterium faeni]
MSSPIFDLIVSQRDATPIFETISGSFPSVKGDDFAVAPARARVRVTADRAVAPRVAPDRVPGGSVPTTTWPLGRVG